MPGVARASASIYMLLKPDGGMSMGVPQGILGSDLRSRGYENFKLTMAEGRDLAADDRGKAVVGSDIAKALNAKVGKTVDAAGQAVRGHRHLRQDPHRSRQHRRRQPGRRPELLYAQLPAMVQQQVNPDQAGHRHHRLPGAGRRRRPARLHHPGHGPRRQGRLARRPSSTSSRARPRSSTASSSAWPSSPCSSAASRWSTP